MLGGLDHERDRQHAAEVREARIEGILIGVVLVMLMASAALIAWWVLG